MNRDARSCGYRCASELAGEIGSCDAVQGSKRRVAVPARSGSNEGSAESKWLYVKAKPLCRRVCVGMSVRPARKDVLQSS